MKVENFSSVSMRVYVQSAHVSGPSGSADTSWRRERLAHIPEERFFRRQRSVFPRRLNGSAGRIGEKSYVPFN